jgi:hypothetical protein
MFIHNIKKKKQPGYRSMCESVGHLYHAVEFLTLKSSICRDKHRTKMLNFVCHQTKVNQAKSATIKERNEVIFSFEVHVECKAVGTTGPRPKGIVLIL